MEKKLFKWQQEALDRSATEASYGLFADPGTGKTFAALTIAKEWTNNAIVVCPLSVKDQWHKEAKIVKIPTAVFHYEQLRQKDSFNAIAKALKSQDTTLILDESHRIKSPSTQTTKAALKIAPLAKRRLALTGTPTANSPADLYTQLAFLRPERKMETYRDFQSEYIESLPYNHPLMKKIGGRPFIAKKDKYGRMVLRNIDKLKARVASYGCTVKLEDVVELPERTFVQKYCEPSKDLLKTYNTLRKNFIAEFKGQEITAQNAAVLAGRLVRLTSGYGHADFEVSFTNPKLKDMLDDIEQYASVGKVIVWSVWVDERKDVIEALCKEGYAVATEPKDFIEGDAQILVASPKMFGTGLNLQLAKYQLWLSRSWSLLEREQALARNYRAGQTQKTLVVDYLTKGTIDELVLGALETKTDLLNQIMTTGEL
jgi:SNF2 family DNA or RNA helicase